MNCCLIAEQLRLNRGESERDRVIPAIAESDNRTSLSGSNWLLET